MKGRNTRLASAFVFAAVLALPARGVAQIVTIGVKAGVNVADVSFDDPAETVDTDNVTGLIAGGFVRLGGPVFAVQPELLFSQKGFSTGDLDGAEAEFSLDYFEVPVLLSARLPAPLVRPFAYAGPVFSFETSCEASGEEGGISISAECDEIDVTTETTDVGVAFGAGVDLNLGRVNLIGDLRYTLGLRDVDPDEDAEAKNRAWSIMAGIGIPIL